jgi:DedD protein
MDRRVKERLIGASILVALVVLVVPELLSGPKPSAPTMMKLPASAPEPTRIVTLDLATSKAPASTESDTAGTQGSAAPPATDASSNAAPSASAGQPSAGQSSAGQSREGQSREGQSREGQSREAQSREGQSSTRASGAPPQAAAPVETLAPSPISARSAWAVQLGSFISRANADNLSRQLKGQGYSVYVLPGGSGAQVRYRVRVGPLADRGAAERMAGKLKSIGHVSSLVGPAG